MPEATLYTCCPCLVIFCLVPLVYESSYRRVLCVHPICDNDKMIVLCPWMFVNVHREECVALCNARLTTIRFGLTNDSYIIQFVRGSGEPWSNLHLCTGLTLDSRV